MSKRIKVRNGFTTSDDFLFEIANFATVNPAVGVEFGITGIDVAFDALGTTKTVTLAATFIDQAIGEDFNTNGGGFKLAANNSVVIGTAVPVAGLMTVPFVFDTEAAFLAFYAEWLADQVIEVSADYNELTLIQ